MGRGHSENECRRARADAEKNAYWPFLEKKFRVHPRPMLFGNRTQNGGEEQPDLPVPEEPVMGAVFLVVLSDCTPND